VPITVSEAALGVKKQIPTLYGNVLLNIKPGVQNYTKLKLKDKGVKQANSLRIGDMYAVINIIVPRKLSKEEKALFKKLDELTLNKEEEFKTFDKYI
jgi:molecular chaperone DnaJ